MAEKDDPRAKTLKQILAENVQALLDRDFPAPHIDRRGQIAAFVESRKPVKIHLSRIQDVVKHGTANLKTLENLALAFKVKPYQLLIPGLNPDMPQVAVDKKRMAAAMERELTEETQ